MHRLDPVAKTVHDHPANDGMIGVERVPSATVVCIARPVLFEDVVRAVVQATEAQGGPTLVAFRRMIEDHVENHFDAGPMQRFDHVAKLGSPGQANPDASCRPDAA